LLVVDVRRFATGRLEVELYDHETEHDVIDDRVSSPDHQDQPRLLVIAAEEVQAPVGEARREGEPVADAQGVADHEAEPGQHGVHHEQRRRHEHESELDGFSDSGEERRERGRTEDAGGGLAALGSGSVDHG
jgi:hypothetical protein